MNHINETVAFPDDRGPGPGRVRYKDAGLTARSVFYKARELGVNGRDFMNLTAVVELTALYSKLKDRAYLQEIASVAYGVETPAKWQVKKTRDSLRRLESLGLVRCTPPTDGVRGRRNYVIELLYQPGTRWDPKTAGSATSESSTPVGSAPVAYAVGRNAVATADVAFVDVPTDEEELAGCGDGGPVWGPDQGQSGTQLGPRLGDPSEEHSEERSEDDPPPPREGTAREIAEALVQEQRPGVRNLQDLVAAVTAALSYEDEVTVRRALQESSAYPASANAFNFGLVAVAEVSYLPDEQFRLALREKRHVGHGTLKDAAESLGFMRRTRGDLVEDLKYRWIELDTNLDADWRQHILSATANCLLDLMFTEGAVDPQILVAVIEGLDPIDRKLWDQVSASYNATPKGLVDRVTSADHLADFAGT